MLSVKMLSNIDLGEISGELGINLQSINPMDLSKFDQGPHILNLDRKEGTGTHWVAYYVNNDTVYYFDSFGQGISDLFKNRAGRNGIKKFYYSITQTQNILSDLCGFHVLFWLHQMENKSGSFLDRMKEIDFDLLNYDTVDERERYILTQIKKLLPF